MPDKQRKTERKYTSLGLVLTGIVFLHVSFNSPTAIAAPEHTASGDQEISLDGYFPDQSLWAEKTIAKYAKAKDTPGAPLAMLKIERLNVEAPIYIGTDRLTLDRGIGLVKGTAYPDEVGNIGLSGHRDSFFRPLKDIKIGDKIEMRTLEGVQDFEVAEISIVDALDVSVLDPTDTTVLTLITCHPFYYSGYAPDRYIVRATPVDKTADTNRHPTSQQAVMPVAGGVE